MAPTVMSSLTWAGVVRPAPAKAVSCDAAGRGVNRCLVEGSGMRFDSKVIAPGGALVASLASLSERAFQVSGRPGRGEAMSTDLGPDARRLANNPVRHADQLVGGRVALQTIGTVRNDAHVAADIAKLGDDAVERWRGWVVVRAADRG